MVNKLQSIASLISSPVERRLFNEYGAIFTTRATPPPTVIFSSAAEVEAFQSTLTTTRARIGQYEMELQSEAMEALMAAVADMNAVGGSISPRAADSAARSYEDTVMLWTRNVTRGLEHWLELQRITPERAERIRALAPVAQVEVILEMEDAEQIYFGTFFDRSILYSVAAPGASQHLALLAFDVAEYEKDEVERTLARRGWFRTVPNDLPHFTYLGHSESALESLGLKRITRDYGERAYSFWVPDIDRLL
ncbi:MAG TPA: hypothetical protein VNN73_20965 [Blastocatellia bacterium]|nr:hypothetical protein [Blastocatellia bacterium]